ncbi:MAG: nucleotidyltransferase family protein [Chloracidobacterium sp.]|nr:nucleotidyltransferase family protein [Chloracidobacterium sp.]
MTQFSEETKQKIAELCRKNKVRELSIFGSRARGDNRPDSDYDLLVEFRADADVDLFDYSRMMVDLQEVIGAKVDLVDKKGLKRLIRPHVLAEAQLIYEG